MLLATIIAALLFDFINGFHDASNIVATAISSRALSPRRALILAALAEFSGPFLLGIAVASTIGEQILPPTALTLPILLSALVGAITWDLITWWFGLPSSSSHALVGGLIGAAFAAHQEAALRIAGISKVLLALLVSPLLGLIAGFLFMKLTLFLARGATPRINKLFKRGQYFSLIALALSHGSNDAQKTMGLITSALLVAGQLDHFTVPNWVIILCATAIALGMALGGWRIIRTLGGRFYKIRPVHGFTAQWSAALIILGIGALGGPVSTTHVVSTAILGAGSAERPSKVRWTVARSIAIAWILTIPASIVTAILCYQLFRVFHIAP